MGNCDLAFVLLLISFGNTSGVSIPSRCIKRTDGITKVECFRFVRFVEDLPSGIPKTTSFLQLSHNKIQTVKTVPFLPNLTEVNLNVNGIESVCWQSLRTLPKLRRLSLSYNHITHLALDLVIHRLPELRYVDLSHNRLSTFSAESIGFSTASQGSIFLQANPFCCDESLTWLMNISACIESCDTDCCLPCSVSPVFDSMRQYNKHFICKWPDRFKELLLREAFQRLSTKDNNSIMSTEAYVWDQKSRTTQTGVSNVRDKKLMTTKAVLPDMIHSKSTMTTQTGLFDVTTKTVKHSSYFHSFATPKDILETSVSDQTTLDFSNGPTLPITIIMATNPSKENTDAGNFPTIRLILLFICSLVLTSLLLAVLIWFKNKAQKALQRKNRNAHLGNRTVHLHALPNPMYQAGTSEVTGPSDQSQGSNDQNRCSVIHPYAETSLLEIQTF